ncbi:filamentous hemagglutinin N-terminal domain-containing protein [Providencia huaxiensis]|uniref:two-partner secretion domain-containing protein n=1 Tax=Providencia TaxID=586 RepID=UPI000F798BE7|nr:filamentous hemagglutinin N-terminal domain-containing protein [Providencia rettgeri]MBV2190804.1 filamentous hemagglutinin N-terminal domain-containing protein [Providencia rettgeri]HEC8322640.1 filamentous hemagglutinin N-terminal domain-containing protein [Providencia rettgeri]
MKHTSNHSITHPMMKIKPLFLNVSIILGSISIAHGAVINTNGAGVINQSNGPTIVQIKGASDKGVSHNIYSQFDVDQKGVILNNSTTNTNTTLGGQINGNLNLGNGNGPAKVILNEVNSNKASTLGGMIEVAGDKAQVIVANASGITCNNCGFINTDRVTLTTGKPIVAGGEVLGYNVSNGQITINNRLQSDSPTDIIARSAVIRGNITAKEINVITGNNFVDADATNITKLPGSNSTPRVGIDVAAMGGMYADKITLVSTESGTGVSNLGMLSAGSGGIKIDSTGLVYNQNALMNSNGTIDIKSNGLYNNSSIVAQGDISINNHNTVISNNAGLIKSNGGNIKIAAGTINNNQRGVIHAQQDIEINTNHLTNNNGSIKTKQGNIDITSTNSIDNSYSIYHGAINEPERGIRAGGKLTIDTTKLHNNNSVLSGQDVALTGRYIITNDSNGQIIAKRRIDIDAETLQNQNALIKSTNGQTNITLSSNLLNNRYGVIDSGKALNINANILYNDGSLISNAGKSKYNVTTLNNQNGYIKGNNLNIKATYVGNDKGLITADSNVVINSSQIDNTNSAQFNNSGNIFGAAGYTGGIYAKNGSVTIKGTNLNNKYGIISANTFQNAGTDGDVKINLKNNLENSYGKILASKTINLDMNRLNNTYSGFIRAGKDLSINAFSRVENNNGVLSSYGKTEITSPVIYNGPYGRILGSTVVLNTSNYY